MVLQFRTIRNNTVAINDQWFFLKPEFLWLSIVNALQLNELSALRNTFYPEYKYVCMYVRLMSNVPTNISNLFIKATEKHNHDTRFSSSCNFYINRSRLNQTMVLLLGSELSFGTPFAMINRTSSTPQESFQKTYQWHVIFVIRGRLSWIAHSDSKKS